MVTGRITSSQELEFALRILCACICGAAIGAERTRRLKEAGVRTHWIVACTAAVLMIISKYGFTDLTSEDGTLFYGTRGADAARIAAQVVSGISFLGAGVIFKNGNTIKGLTTAAGMWATASIGLSFGAGMYFIGFAASVLVLIIQVVMHRVHLENGFYQSTRLEMTVKNTEGILKKLRVQMADWHAQAVEMKIQQNSDGTTTYKMTVRTTKPVSYEEILDFAHTQACTTVSIETDTL